MPRWPIGPAIPDQKTFRPEYLSTPVLIPSAAIGDLYVAHSHLRMYEMYEKCFKKGIQNFVDPENMKKPPSKLDHNQPPTIFYVLAKWPRNRNLVPHYRK